MLFCSKFALPPCALFSADPTNHIILHFSYFGKLVNNKVTPVAIRKQVLSQSGLQQRCTAAAVNWGLTNIRRCAIIIFVNSSQKPLTEGK